ncbi:hypothetical protein DFH06DRAFT_1059957 [Mycena polygramma]|nr:hypothetical protein DFH06DRAFT_1059957 [Mycena polygramma]
MAAANIRARIDELSLAIQRQEEILQNLRKSRNDTRCELNAVVDPMARLPLEISSGILSLCVPKFPHPSQDGAPVAFLYVCRAWRTIAFSSALLWAALRIRSAWSRELPDGVHNWFTRARGLPLSLSVQGTADRVVQHLVRKYASQLQNLEINCPSGMHLAQIPAAWFTSLKTLAIEHSQHRHGQTDMHGWSPCLRMLQNAPNLLKCTLVGECRVNRGSPPTQPQPLKLSGLKYLDLQRTSGLILEYLTLPALESIQVAWDGLRFDTFRAFMTRSSPPLQSLSIRWAGYPEMQDLFLHLSSLSELWLQDADGDRRASDIFKLFALSFPQSLLPNLRRLEVYVFGPFSAVDYRTLLAVLFSRHASHKSGHGLKSFRLYLGSSDTGRPPPETVAPLRELVADGMDIRITRRGEEKNLI